MKITSTLTTPENPTGLIDEATLYKTCGYIEDENESTTWVEYRQTEDGPIIHRSVDMRLKKHAVFAEATAAVFA